MTLLRFVIFTLFLLISGTLSAQHMKISGVINDTLSQKPLYNASIVVIRISDSVMVDFTRSDLQGKFEFTKLPIDTVELLITHPKFNDQSFYILGSLENNTFHIPNIVPLEKTKEIREVVIFANSQPIYYRGDTLVYVADSFNVKPNAVVEDLLKKLPGIEVDKDGKIKAQGKNVEKVLVDGDEFFGSDPLIATRNLGARAVETVEVYEKENENTSDGSTETIQVMNLKLKDEAKQGYFGKVAAGSDFQRFYEGEVLGSIFKKDLKLSVFGQASNTPNSGFSWSDINQYGLDNERQNIIDEDGNWTFVGSAPREGLPQAFKGGFYFTDKIGEKAKVGLNYTFNDNQIIANTNQTSQFFLTDTSYSTDDLGKTVTRVQQHIVNASYEQQFDSLTTLSIKPRFQLNTNTSSSETTTDFFDADRNAFSRTSITNDNNSTELQFSNVAKLTRLFKKKNRKLEFIYQFDYKDNDLEGTLESESVLSANNLTFQSFNQRKTGLLTGTGHLARAFYQEPLGKNWRLEMEYQFNQYQTRQTRSSFNFVGDSYSELDSLFSNDFENKQFVNFGGLFGRFENNKHMVRFGARVRNTVLDNRNLFTNEPFRQDVNNVLPRFTYHFKIKQSSRLTFNYVTEADLPSVSQLQPLQDNSNPNRIVVGNPDLKPTYNHTMRLNYHSFKPVSGFYVWAGGQFSYINNAFSNAVDFDAFGRTINQTINVNGNYFGNFYGGTGIPLYKQLFKMNLDLRAGTSSFNNKINGLENTTVNNSLGGGTELVFDKDSIYFKLGGRIDYNAPRSTLSTGANQPYFSQTYTASFSWDIFWNITVGTEGRYIIQSQRAEGFNFNIFLWDVSIKKNFLKDENLVLQLSANDLLNQNTTASRNIQTNVIVDNRTVIISRYFMVKLIYNFKNKIKINKQDEDF
jgi:hypothetical protein